MQRDSTTVIIIFYFGKFPWYQELFLTSCLNNPDIDFIFFSDQFEGDQWHANIRKIHFTLEEFNILASGKLDYRIDVSTGLKMCDLRPAFGVIFEEYIKGYQWWGYSDTDLIFGDISYFLDEEVKRDFDFVSVVPDYPSGFLAFFRNNAKMNTLFLESKDWQKAFTLKNNCLFEECGGYYAEVIAGTNILDTGCEIETFHHALEKCKEEIRSLFEFFSIEGSPGGIVISENRMTIMNFDVLMYHLTNYKNNFFSIRPKWKSIPRKYKIFKYSFRKDTWFGRRTGAAYDWYAENIFRLTTAVDSFLNLKPRHIYTAGDYRYMQESITIAQDGDIFNFVGYNGIYPLGRSVFYKNYCLIKGLDIYLRRSGDTKIEIILKNGYVKPYSRG